MERDLPEAPDAVSLQPSRDSFIDLNTLSMACRLA